MMNFPSMNTVGMMGGYAGYALSAETKTEAELQADIQAAQEAAQIDGQANAIRYTGSEVHLVIVGSPEEADEKFVIGGLINPTLNIPK